MKGKADYVTVLNTHQGLPITQGTKTQILTMACRALQGLDPALPRNLLVLIMHPSLLAHTSLWLFLEPSPPEVQVRPTAPARVWLCTSKIFSSHHVLSFSPCTFLQNLSFHQTQPVLSCLLSVPLQGNRSSQGEGPCGSQLRSQELNRIEPNTW